jgi:phage tail sheath protein FI
LQRGAFRSAAKLHLADVSDVYPILSHNQMHRPITDASGAARSLIQRISLFGPQPDGLRLLSDVTTSLQESYRPAGINRLTSTIVRAARRMGEELTFAPSGERLWAQIRAGLNGLLLSLMQAGALRGTTPTDAFRVRCDRSTMTQNDIDAGRVLVEVQFDPAAPIERITVVLALSEGGQVSVLSDR